MALFTTAKLASLAEATSFANERYAFAQKSASRILLDEARQEPRAFDIFLSHSFQDAQIILTVKRGLEGLGYTVFVDWVEYPELDRRHVTKDVAAFLRRVMQQSTSLFYVATDNAPLSNWMPWECGYFDGIKRLVAIMPIVRSADQSDSFVGRVNISVCITMYLAGPFETQTRRRYGFTKMSPCMSRTTNGYSEVSPTSTDNIFVRR